MHNKVPGSGHSYSCKDPKRCVVVMLTLCTVVLAQLAPNLPLDEVMAVLVVYANHANQCTGIVHRRTLIKHTNTAGLARGGGLLNV